MKLVVCVKQTIDTEAVIEIDEQGCVITHGQTLGIDPYSEFAVERAVQLKEEQGAEVIVVCIGGPEALPTLRYALSMGADCGYLIDDPAAQGSDAAGRALILAAAVRSLAPDLVLGGCKSADTASAQVMPRVATLLSFPPVSVVTALAIDGQTVHATREIDDGIEHVDVSLPAVITAQQGLAEPRYPNVRDIMQSKKKPVTFWTLADLGVDPVLVGPSAAKLIPIRYRTKPTRVGGRVVEGEIHEVVAETVSLLGSEAKVI